MAYNDAFQWKCHPKSEALIFEVLKQTINKNPMVEKLEKDLLSVTSTRLFDWLDHVIVGTTDELEKNLEDYGFISDIATPTYRVFHHPGAQLPKVILNDDQQNDVGVAVTVDSIADFLMVRGMAGVIEGSPLSGFRKCCVSTENHASLWVVERRGTVGIEPTYPDGNHAEKYLVGFEKWQSRPRDMDDEDEAMLMSISIAEDIVNLVGEDMAAWIVLEAERKYWEARNSAAQMQKNRQDKLGMGWANHDHHTFRASRRLFHHLVRLFEILGFHCRERFYAGEEAGWGAQVMEHSNCGLILFLDVDLDPHELHVDFAHHGVPELDQLGTIGLWCALHGDSILKAGMHHLEGQFMFQELRQDLDNLGIGMMKPFSDFPYLKQAFTKGERWSVDPRRVQNLLNKKLIDQKQADQFLTEGVIGSHLENLQRREGYKGFNQKNVSFIIKETDPRKIHMK